MRWSAFGVSEHAVRLIDEHGRHTHTVARVHVGGKIRYEAWRRIPDPDRFYVELIDSFDEPEAAKRCCEQDAGSA